MSEQPAAVPSAGGGKKILGVPRNTFFIIIAAGAVVGVGFLLWRKYQAGAQASTAASSAAPAGDVDQSGELSTIQTELEALLQQQGATTPSGGGTTTGGGGWSGGGGYGGGQGQGGDSGSGSGSGGSGTASDGGAGMAGTGSATTTGGASGTTTPVTSSAAPKGPTGGKATRVSNNGAVVTWNANGAAKWSVKLTGPGPLNGFTNVVTIPQATYSGLSAGHNYEVTVTPESATGVKGPSGTVTFQTTK